MNIHPAKHSCLLFVFLFFFSCDFSRKRSAASVASEEEMGTVYVTGNSATVNAVMKELQRTLYPYQRYFSQPEPYFNIEFVPADSLITKPGRKANYIVIKTGEEALELFQLHLYKEKISKVQLSEKKDIWAFPQSVHVLSGPDTESLKQYLQKQGATFREKLLAAERETEIRRISENASDTIDHFLRDEFDLKMTIPNGYTIAMYREQDHHRFVWIRKEDAKSSQGLFIYTTPYEGEKSLQKESIIARRDSIGKWHVAGERDSTWMSTRKHYPVQARAIKVKERMVTEVRGVWQVAGEHMSGPFYSFTFADEDQQLLYTVEGFVYVPKYSKTPYLRQLEAIINSIRF